VAVAPSHAPKGRVRFIASVASVALAATTPSRLLRSADGYDPRNCRMDLSYDRLEVVFESLPTAGRLAPRVLALPPKNRQQSDCQCDGCHCQKDIDPLPGYLLGSSLAL